MRPSPSIPKRSPCSKTRLWPAKCGKSPSPNHRRRRARDRSNWSLPKGTPDGDETPEQTALREVNEETGLEVRILDTIGDIHYRFVRDGRRIHKTVHYYLMEATGGDLADHDQEFVDVRWVEVAEAEDLVISLIDELEDPEQRSYAEKLLEEIRGP